MKVVGLSLLLFSILSLFFFLFFFDNGPAPLAVYDEQTPSAGSFDLSYYSYYDVLLVCNPASGASNETCNYFMSKHPTLMHRVNLIGVSAADSINCTDYFNLMIQVRNYLQSIPEQINYIVTTIGVPYKATGQFCAENYTSPPYELARSLDSILACDLKGSCYRTVWPGYGAFNASFVLYQRKNETFNSSKYNFYIVTRLMGYDVNDSKALVDRGGPQNINSSSLREGLFVIDDENKYVLTGNKGRFNDTRTYLIGAGHNVLYDGPGINGNYMIANASKVIGHLSWGPYNNGWDLELSANSEFILWENQTAPSNFTIVGGVMYNSSLNSTAGLSTSNNSAKVNATGRFEIYQNYTPTSASALNFYSQFRYGLVNFTGNVSIYIRGFDEFGNLLNESLIKVRGDNYGCGSVCIGSPLNVTTESLSGAEWYGNTPLFRKSSLAKKIQAGVIVELKSGEFYLDRLSFYRHGTSFQWERGAIGTLAQSSSASSFHHTGVSPVASLIADGVTGAEGFVSEPYLDAVAYEPDLFGNYLSGYNLGDSFYMATSSYGNLNWKDIILGDPKTVIAYNGSSLSSISLVNLNNFVPGARIDNSTVLQFSGLSGSELVHYTLISSPTVNYSGKVFVRGNSSFTIALSQYPSGNYNLSIIVYDGLERIRNFSAFHFHSNRTVGLTPTYSKFDGDTTDFELVADRTSTRLVLENASAGKIDFNSRLMNVSGLDLNSYITILNNSIYLNSSALRNLNFSATLYLYNLSYLSNPLILRNGQACNSLCSLNYYDSSSGELSFNVTSFSQYSTTSNTSSPIIPPSTVRSTSGSGGGGTPPLANNTNATVRNYSVYEPLPEEEDRNEENISKIDEMLSELAEDKNSFLVYLIISFTFLIGLVIVLLVTFINLAKGQKKKSKRIKIEKSNPQAHSCS